MKKVGIAILTWFVLFGCTVQVGFSYWIFSRIFVEPQATIFAAIFNLLLAIPLVLTHKKLSEKIFSLKPRWNWFLYVILLIAAIFVPFHYHINLPVSVYIIFITVSVFWQNYITFGLLHTYLRERFSLRMTMLIITALFISAHLIFIPDFWYKPMNIVFVLILAPLFTYLKEKTGTLHLPIFIHLLFYFIMS